MKERIADANERAQEAFHAMLEAGVYGLPDHPLTIAYTAAERFQDALIAAEQARIEAEGRAIKSRWGDPDLSFGDHHIGVGK